MPVLPSDFTVTGGVGIGTRASSLETSSLVAKPVERLILIYNADSGAFNAALDSLKKLLSLESCPLCAITHGTLMEKSDWKKCSAEAQVPIEYLHKDELDPALSALVGTALPSVVAYADGIPAILLGPDPIKACRGSVDHLRSAIRESVQELGFEVPGI